MLLVNQTPPVRVRSLAKFFFEGDRKFFVKGATYGPFKPDTAGDYLGPEEQARRDLSQRRELGINVVRMYRLPPRWFLDCCSEAGVRVLITLPWAKHVEFLVQAKSDQHPDAGFR